MEVSVDELLVLVNIALGNAPVSRCEPGDVDGSGEITIDEILGAVNRALNGCGEAAVAPRLLVPAVLPNNLIHRHER